MNQPNTLSIKLDHALTWSIGHPTRTISIYVAIITLAELVTTFVAPVLGMVLHCLLLASAIVHAGLTWEHPLHRMLLALTFAPLIRILSLSLPLGGFDPIYWYFIVSVPLFFVAYMVIRLLGYTSNEIGLHTRGLTLQLLIGCSGLVFGVMEYLILQPEPLINTLNMDQLLLPVFILLVSTGFMEELVFRGIMQNTFMNAIGPWQGLFFATLVFAILHVGYKSWIDVAFVFLIGLAFGFIWMKTRCLLGIVIAHGLVNIMLFMVLPHLFALSQTPQTPLRLPVSGESPRYVYSNYQADTLILLE